MKIHVCIIRVIRKITTVEFLKQPRGCFSSSVTLEKKNLVCCRKVLSVPHPIKVLYNLVENTFFHANLIIINTSQWMRQNLMKLSPSATERER